MIGLLENTGASEKPGHLINLTEAIFKRGGYLQSVLNLDYREEQSRMAESVAASLESDSPLLFEAGTGIGKSLAYLIPGIIHAIEKERPFIVSSHTIALQEQIRHKDLSICQNLFKGVPALKRYASFKTAVMLGRSNYCCTTRLINAINESDDQQSELLPNQAVEDLTRLTQWSTTSTNGVLQELNPPPLPDVWDQINADSSSCSRKNCDASVCFYQRARKQLFAANCIILNHSLLFSLIHAGMPPGEDTRGILLPDDCIVLDEAHRIPSIATDHFGLHITSFGLDRALKRLYNPRTRRGQFKKTGSPKDCQAVESALSKCHEFFEGLNQDYLKERSIVRIHQAGICQNIVSSPVREVINRIASLIEKTDEERLQDELGDHRRRLSTYLQGIDNFIQLAEEDHVYWLEKSGKNGTITTLRSAPLDVAPYLKEALFDRGSAAILTSATLSDGKQLDAFRNRVGAYGAESEILTSPFDYAKNCHVFISSDAPEPEPHKGRLDLDYLAENIIWSSQQTEGGTLVLFTSYQDLRAVRERTIEAFRKINRPLYCQGQDGPRTELVKRFAKDGSAILFGTDSFWTGIDIPGPALSQIIITRLPFKNPGHPVSEARFEKIRLSGGNPFAESVIPEALIKFRQGIGRLIRRQEDKGHIIILDSRILKKPYGRNFLDALPLNQYYSFCRKNRSQRFQENSLFKSNARPE